MTPELTVVVNFYNMRREAARTLYTLSAKYQRDVSSDQYRVVAVDNGSSEPLDPAMVRGFGDNFRYHYYETDSPSPGDAINWGVEQAETPWVAVLIDGARMLSPGILSYVLRAFRAFERPFVYTLGMHLGPEAQPISRGMGYSQEQEDMMLDRVAWRHDGYRLFEVSSLALSCSGGYFADMAESNCFAMARSAYLALGGYNPLFQSAGGGLVNLDFFRRACESGTVDPVLLLGEATFHQFHGGTATNARVLDNVWTGFDDEYERIRGMPYRRVSPRFHVLGHVPAACEALVGRGPRRTWREVRHGLVARCVSVWRRPARFGRRVIGRLLKSTRLGVLARERLNPPPSRGGRVSGYYDLERSANRVAAGSHRGLVGGLWSEIGDLAKRLVIAEGLVPKMTFLDIGCGCLRVGVHMVDYLDAGHYFGTDLSQELLSAGYERELRPLGLDDKLPRENLLHDGDFRFERFERASSFDMALALSVFTHLPPEYLRLCLQRLEPHMPVGAKFLVTIFHCKDSSEMAGALLHAPGSITTYPDRDPYHYRADDLKEAASGLAWSVGEPRDWSHPRGQRLVVFTREN